MKLLIAFGLVASSAAVASAQQLLLAAAESDSAGVLGGNTLIPLGVMAVSVSVIIGLTWRASNIVATNAIEHREFSRDLVALENRVKNVERKAGIWNDRSPST